MHYYFNGNFSSYSNTEFFLIGLLILTPNGVVYQPLNVLSKCLIWNRETLYFKEKSILCSNYKLPRFDSEQSSRTDTRGTSECICVIFVSMSIRDIERVKKRALGKRTALVMISDRNHEVDLLIFQVQFSNGL